MKVMDSSVILKWVLPEQGADHARDFIVKHIAGDIQIHAPQLLLYEITNVLACKSRLTDADLSADLADLLSLEFELSSFELDDLLSTAELARRHNISVYDAAYVYLAQKLNCDFITADKKLVEKTQSLPFVKLLH